jgi:protocatechuate 3,4-dioxygenase beta subunit
MTPTPLEKIFGRVVDSKGRPVADAGVYLFTGDANDQTWVKTARPQFSSGTLEVIRDTVICETRTDAKGRWTILAVRNSGAGSISVRYRPDWSKYCVGILGPGDRNLLVHDVVVPEAGHAVELLIDLDARTSRTVATQPGIAGRSDATQPAAPPVPPLP